MQEYTIRSSHASTIAIDQHARSVAMCALDISTGETRSTKLAGCPTAGDIVGWAAAWATPPMRFVYESGPCGFQLARDIRALGHDCDMIAVSSIARSVDDKRLKDDRRDAASLLGAVTAPGSKSFWLSALYRAGGCAFSCCLLHALANTLIGVLSLSSISLVIAAALALTGLSLAAFRRRLPIEEVCGGKPEWPAP